MCIRDRPRSGRGVEVEYPGVVSRRIDLHRRDLQERREDDLRQGRLTQGPLAPLQLQPGWQHQARHRLPRGREDQRESLEGSYPRGSGAERLPGAGLIPCWAISPTHMTHNVEAFAELLTRP